MRSTLAALIVALLALGTPLQRPVHVHAEQAAGAQLPPLVYICPMPEDAEIMDDKPGKCPKCGMDLIPIRLDSKFWCPTHQTVVVRDGPGKCPLDQKELVQVTLSEFWTCADKPDTKLLEPGNCSNGRPRAIKYELAAHGDHNPKHGGMLFMASDAWHHIEGVYPQPGLFRVHFYDNFTKPMAAKGFSGSVVLLDKQNKEVASYPLAITRNGQTMEARIPAPQSSLPLNAAVKVKFKAGEKDNFFNFPFAKLTVDPVPPTPAPAASTSTAARPAAPRPAAPAVASATARPSPAPAATPSPAPAAQAPMTMPMPAPAAQTAQAPLILDSPLNMPPGLADATDETKLPKDVAGLLAELDTRASEVAKLVNAGELAQVWLPAMGTKTVALMLDTHASALPERQRAAASAAVKQIVMASWEIDNYGDLGNLQKINDAHRRLAAAVQSLKALYAQ